MKGSRSWKWKSSRMVSTPNSALHFTVAAYMSLALFRSCCLALRKRRKKYISACHVHHSTWLMLRWVPHRAAMYAPVCAPKRGGAISKHVRLGPDGLPVCLLRMPASFSWSLNFFRSSFCSKEQPFPIDILRQYHTRRYARMHPCVVQTPGQAGVDQAFRCGTPPAPWSCPTRA